LFRTDPNHAETRLFRGTTRIGVYLTADYWLSRKSYEEFLALRRSEYKALDAATENLTLSEHHIGSLETDAPTINCEPTERQDHRGRDRA
jgi:hypothetical protein